MKGRDTFFRIISPDHLYAGALLFTILTAFTVGTIYLFLYLKKRRHRVKTLLNDTIDDWIADVMTEGITKAEEVPGLLNQYLKKKIFRQFIIDKLINIKKNISGQPAADIESIYMKLGLLNDSLAKMNSSLWHRKAKGIYELGMMNMHASAANILPYTNHRNKFVRREAQSALVGFYGFDGLSFLDELTQPLLEWQHLKLLTQLQNFDMNPMTKLSSWLSSNNPYVVVFSLKLVEIYMQYDMHEAVVKKLNEENDKIRYHAIKALGAISNDDTAAILIDHYNNESKPNKIEILKQLSMIGSASNNNFLHNQLAEADNDIKLAVIRTLMSVNGVNHMIEQPDATTTEMSLQVKKELAWK
ncbi:MAG: HEAT repeat domain-containing protein [Taibaiella sp.]|nr:HEAT repeat domain-containing protein [Taibaiella sp.]